MKQHRTPLLRNAGFSLVEIMVGMAIGLLVTIIIMQVMSTFEAQKRTTTGTADAQTNGNIALYNIGRELQLAGYPLMPVTDSPLECTTLNINGALDATAPNRLTPVTITDGGGGASDTITLRYGDTAAGGIPTPITSITANDATVNSNFGCRTGDTTLVVNGATCSLSIASAVPAAGSVASAVDMTVTLSNTTSAIQGANLSCLGRWNEVVYAVNNGNLERSAVPTVEGIVNIQAQYGISITANSNQITQWVNASGGTWAAPTVANRNRIKAIRIAIVARNAKLEPTAVTTACSSLTLAAPTGLCSWDATSASPVVASPAPAIDLTADANWARYRYRVFETIIPLRNVIWAKSTL